MLGKVNFASQVIVWGRAFTRGLYDATRHVTRSYYYGRLSAACLLDMLWWKELLCSCNGRSYFLEPEFTPAPAESSNDWTREGLLAQSTNILHLLCGQHRLVAIGSKPAMVNRLLSLAPSLSGASSSSSSRAPSSSGASSSGPTSGRPTSNPNNGSGWAQPGAFDMALTNILDQLTTLRARSPQCRVPSLPCHHSYYPMQSSPLSTSLLSLSRRSPIGQTLNLPPLPTYKPRLGRRPGRNTLPQSPAPDVHVVDERRRSGISRSLLPTVPVRLRDRIMRGGYIDFDDLLPENLADQILNSLEVQAATGEGNHRQLTINLGRPKRRVLDFSAWLHA